MRIHDAAESVVAAYLPSEEELYWWAEPFAFQENPLVYFRLAAQN